METMSFNMCWNMVDWMIRRRLLAKSGIKYWFFLSTSLPGKQFVFIFKSEHITYTVTLLKSASQLPLDKITLF